MRSSDRSVRLMIRRAGAAPSSLPGDVVRHRGAARAEAAVAAARATRDAALLVEPHAHAALGQREGAGAARDAAADHRDLGAAAQGTVEGARRPARRASTEFALSPGADPTVTL